MLPPKTFHHANFHRDRSNQLGEKCYVFGIPDIFYFTDGQKRNYLSRVSQRARGATENEKSPSQGVWLWSRDLFEFLVLPTISPERLS